MLFLVVLLEVPKKLPEASTPRSLENRCPGVRVFGRLLRPRSHFAQVALEKHNTQWALHFAPTVLVLLHMYIYVYICIHMYICVYVYIYMYVHINV